MHGSTTGQCGAGYALSIVAAGVMLLKCRVYGFHRKLGKVPLERVRITAEYTNGPGVTLTECVLALRPTDPNMRTRISKYTPFPLDWTTSPATDCETVNIQGIFFPANWEASQYSLNSCRHYMKVDTPALHHAAVTFDYYNHFNMAP